jgi:hypothetical protein
MSEIKNWAGLPIHPTDEYVHWSEKNVATKMQELRQHWDNVVSAGSEESLKVLLSAAHQAGRQEEWDANAGEGL